jgi:hypothetical protein
MKKLLLIILVFLSLHGFGQYEDIERERLKAADALITDLYFVWRGDTIDFSKFPIRYILPIDYYEVTEGFNTEIPIGYMIHSIHVNHSTTSSGNTATFSLGTGELLTNLIDPYNGLIDDNSKVFSFNVNYRPKDGNPEQIYFNVSGSGIKLDVIIIYQYAKEDEWVPKPSEIDETQLSNIMKAGASSLVAGYNSLTFANPFSSENFTFIAEGYSGGNKVKVHRTAQTKTGVTLYVTKPCIINWTALKY